MIAATQNFRQAFGEFMSHGVLPRPRYGEKLEVTGGFVKSEGATDEMPLTIKIVSDSKTNLQWSAIEKALLSF